MRAPLISLYGEGYFRSTWGSWVDAMEEIYEKNKGDICMNLLRNIKCPTLICHGAKDVMVHKDHPEFLSENIKNSKLVQSSGLINRVDIIVRITRFKNLSESISLTRGDTTCILDTTKSSTSLLPNSCWKIDVLDSMVKRQCLQGIIRNEYYIMLHVWHVNTLNMYSNE